MTTSAFDQIWNSAYGAAFAYKVCKLQDENDWFDERLLDRIADEAADIAGKAARRAMKWESAGTPTNGTTFQPLPNRPPKRR